MREYCKNKVAFSGVRNTELGSGHTVKTGTKRSEIPTNYIYIYILEIPQETLGLRLSDYRKKGVPFEGRFEMLR